MGLRKTNITTGLIPQLKEIQMDEKVIIEIKVVLQAIKRKIEIFNEIEIQENIKKEVCHSYLYGASHQALKGIESIIDKELSKIEG